MPTHESRQQTATAFLQRNLDYVVFCGLFIFFSLHWFTGFKVLPWDAMDQFYPMSRFTVDTLRRGDLPWWNPYQYSGNPFFADPQSLIFTAFTPIGLLAGSSYTPAAFSAITLLHLLLGGMALIAYARTLDTSPLQRVVAAIVFAMAAVATSRLQHVPQIVTYAYLPIILLSIQHWMLHRTFWRWTGLTALLALFAVNPNQLTLLGGLALFVVVALHWLASKARRWVDLLWLALAALLALAIASPVLAAVAEFAGLSARSALSVADSQPSSFPLFVLTAFAFPGVVGIGGVEKALWMPNDLTENWLYVGAMPLLLLLVSRGTSHRLLMAGAAVSIAAFALFSLGTNSSLYPWLYNNVAGFNLFRRPADGAYVALLLTALLVLYAGPPRRLRPWRLLAAALATAVVVLLVAHLTGASAFAEVKNQFASYITNGAAVVMRYLLIGTALALVQRRYADGWASHPGAVAILALVMVVEVTAPARYREFVGVSRSWAPGQLYRNKLRTDESQDLRRLVDWLYAHGAGGERATVRFEAAHAPLGRAFPSAFGISNTLGYSPIRLRAYHDTIGAPEPWLPRTLTAVAPGYDSRWFQAFGLRYVSLSAHHLDAADSGDGLANLAKSLRAELIRSSGQRLLRIGNDELWQLPEPNPAVSLVATTALAELAPARHDPALGQCSLLSRTANSYAARCTVNAAATVLFSEVYYPGWYACVDGRKTTIGSAWGVLRSIPIEPGEHKIVMRFEPVPFWRRGHCDPLDFAQPSASGE